MKKQYIKLGFILLSSCFLTAYSTEKIVVSGWAGNDVVMMNNLLQNALIDDIKAANINVEYKPIEGDFTTFLTNSLSAGTAPDVFYVDVIYANAFISTGKLEPINENLQAIASETIQSLNEAFIVEEKQYGIVKDFNTLALQYNKDIFDYSEVEYPNDQDDWYSFKDKLTKVKQAMGDDVTGLCIMPNYDRFAPFALSTGWVPFNDQGQTILDDRFKKAFEFYTSLKTDGVATLASDLSHGWSGGCLGDELAAVAIEGLWVGGYLTDKAPNMIYGTSLLPKDPESKNNGNLIFSVAWGVNADSPNKDAAQKLVKILSSEKAQMAILNSSMALPGRENLKNSDYFQKDDQTNLLAKKVFEGAEKGNLQAFNFGEHGAAWMDPINEALAAVLFGEKNIEDALADAQKKYNLMVTKGE